MENFSSNPGRVHSEGLVHQLSYIKVNKNLGLKYYTKIEDAPLSDLLRQAIIKSENQFIMFSDSIWKYYPDTVRSIGSYILFYQGGPIGHFTHVPFPVAQASYESEYNAVCNALISIAHFIILINELMSKYIDVVP